jgi:hypothetical protein
VEVGVNAVLFTTPFVQVYVVAPAPLNVTVPPTHINVDVAFAVIVGKALTVILRTALFVLVQFAVLVPDTV